MVVVTFFRRLNPDHLNEPIQFGGVTVRIKIGILVVILMLGVMFASELMVSFAQTTDAEIQKLVDDRIRERNEKLDQRSEFIDRWLTVLGIVVAFFGVVIPILIALAAMFSLKKFQELETKARNIIDKIETDAQKSKNDVRKILADSEKYSGAIKEKWSQVNNVPDESSAKIIPNPEEETAEIIQEISKKPDSSAINKKDITEAYKLQQDGKIHEAIEKWRAIADTAQGTDDELAAMVWACLSDLYFRKFDDNQTISDFDKAQALSALDKAIELKPDFAEAYSLRGTVKFSLDADHEAIDDYDEAIRLKSDNARSYHGRGLVKYFLGEYQDAVSDCDKVIHLTSNSGIARKLRGDANTGLGNYEEALADYDKAIDYDQDNAEAYLGRANVKVLLGQYEAAINDIDKTIDLEGDHAKAHALRGTMKLSLGKIDEAVTDFQTALDLAIQQGHFELKTYLERQLQELNNATR